MDFNKIAQDMLEMQIKLDIYETRNKKLKELLTLQLKEVTKIEKKIQSEINDFDKLILQIKLLMLKDALKKIEGIYRNSSEEIGRKIEKAKKVDHEV